jgi:hypothetical protein
MARSAPSARKGSARKGHPFSDQEKDTHSPPPTLRSAEMWVSRTSRTSPRNVGVPYLSSRTSPAYLSRTSARLRRNMGVPYLCPPYLCPVPLPGTSALPYLCPYLCRTSAAVPLLFPYLWLGVPYLCTSGWVSRTSVPLPGVPYLYRTSTSRSTSRTSAVPPRTSAPPRRNVMCKI